MTEALPHQFVTDPDVAPTEAPATVPLTESIDTPQTESSGRRGRPRSQEAIARDEAVFAALDNGAQLTRNEIAEKVGFAGGLTYLSIYRLRREGRVLKVSDGTTRRAWRQVTDADRAAVAEAVATLPAESAEA